MTPRYPFNYPNNILFLGQYEEVDLYFLYDLAIQRPLLLIIDQEGHANGIWWFSASESLRLIVEFRLQQTLLNNPDLIIL